MHAIITLLSILSLKIEHSVFICGDSVLLFDVGYAQHIRDELSEIKILQNLQMARLCDIAGKNMFMTSHVCTNNFIQKLLECFVVDPKVDVIYISPVELNDEVYQYYSKLLGMKAKRLDQGEPDSKETGDEEEDDIENRYKIIVPDAVDRFPVSQSHIPINSN